MPLDFATNAPASHPDSPAARQGGRECGQVGGHPFAGPPRHAPRHAPGPRGRAEGVSGRAVRSRQEHRLLYKYTPGAWTNITTSRIHLHCPMFLLGARLGSNPPQKCLQILMRCNFMASRYVHNVLFTSSAISSWSGCVHAPRHNNFNPGERVFTALDKRRCVGP